MNERDLQFAVINRSSVFNLSKNFMVIPNVSHGGFYWGEADLVAMSKSYYLTEGEIKVSIQDLKADFKKQKYTNETYNKKWTNDIKRHFFIVPDDIKEKALEVVSKTNSGLIYVSKNKHGNFSCFTIKEAVVNNKAKKISIERALKICRLISFRFWNKM